MKMISTRIQLSKSITLAFATFVLSNFVIAFRLKNDNTLIAEMVIGHAF